MRSSARRTASTVGGRVLLAVLLLWAAGSLCVSFSLLWTPRGNIGLTSNYSGTITGVTPGLPADRAHIAVGDRILLWQTPFESRPKVVGTTTPIAPGTAVSFALVHDSAVRSVTLIAVKPLPSVADRVSLVIENISAAIFIIVGAALIWLRPSLVTWAFGLFGLLSNPVVPALSRFPSAPAHLAYVLLYDVLQNVGVIGLLAFALNFPKPLDVRWRNVLARALPAIFAVLALWTLFIDLAVCVFSIPAHQINVGLQVAFGVVDVLAIALITETYVKGPSENRPRLRWVLVGFYVGLVCNYVGNTLLYTANVALPVWFDNMLIASEVTLPLAVSYAIVHHRVIDVDLFVSRALVYAIFTTVLVVLFGVTDWIFSQLLADFRLSIILDAGISVGLALVFDSVQKVLEKGVARFVFRARQIAWDRLERAGKTFRFVSDAASIDRTIVAEPHEALDIASVAFFRRDGDEFNRVSSVGWSEREGTAIPRNDRLVLEHMAQEGSLYLSEIPYHYENLPRGIDAPVVSIPLRSASELTGMLLCSAKRNGEEVDVDELRRLIAFVDLAAVAYDRLDAEELRKKTEDLERQVGMLNARLDEARHPRLSS